MIKRLCLFLVAMAVLCTGAYAEGPALSQHPLSETERLAVLDQLIHSVETADASGDLQTLQEALLDRLREASPDDVALLSCAPDGSGWFGAAATLPFYRSTETGEATVLWPDIPGSVQNETYGLRGLQRLYEAKPSNLYGPDSFHWSPDGRYIALTSWRLVAQQFRGDIDLYIVDTQAGTIRMRRTFEGHKLTDRSAAILQACFASDSRTVYHTAYGSLDQGRITLWAQDVDADEATFLLSGADEDAGIYGDLAQLVLLPDGGLLQVMDAPKGGVACGVFTYAPDADGAWARTAHTLPLTPFVPWSVSLSPQSGLGILHLRTSAGGSIAITALDFSSGFDGMDRLLVFRSLQGGPAEQLPLESLAGAGGAPSKEALAIYPAMAFSPGGDTALPDNPALLCLASAMSPAGDQALLLMRDTAAEQFGFLLLDMQTLEAAPVAFDWDEATHGAVQVAWGTNTLGLAWAAGGQVAVSVFGQALPLAWE